jgi:hypothetical protein
MKLKEGMIVEHPLKHNEWGPGKVIAVHGNKVHILFRDDPGRMVKIFHTDKVFLRISSKQSDPILDNIPPLQEAGGKYSLPEKRLNVSAAISLFKEIFPLGFKDPEYLGNKFSGERNYKLWAHQEWVKTLGNGQAEDLLKRGDIDELTRRAMSVLSRVNLLSPFENMAIRDALKDYESAKQFFTTLMSLLSDKKISKERFEIYVNTVCNLPQAKGKSRVATWPVATILPFLAQPDRHMFLKPKKTQAAAKILAFDLHYNPTPNWVTYESLLRMSEIYREKLKRLAPNDNIDIQSFFWVVSGKY